MTLKTKTKRILAFFLGAFALIVLGLISFAFYHLIFDTTTTGIGLLGLETDVQKNLAIIIGGAVILLILGYSGKGILKEVLH